MNLKTFRRWIVPLSVGAALGVVYWWIESERLVLLERRSDFSQAFIPQGTSDTITRLFVLGLIAIASVAAVQITDYLAVLAEERSRSQTLQAERDRVEKYLETTGMLMVALDSDGCVEMVNAALCELLGRPEEELLGADWFEQFALPETRVQDRMRFNAVIRGLRELDLVEEIPLPIPDGSTRLVRWMSSLLRDDTGAVAGMLSSGIDLTEERARDADLQLKSFVLDNSIDSVVVHTLDGRVLYANQHACDDTGLARDAFLALPPFGWVASEYAGCDQEALQRLADEDEVMFESGIRGPDGRLVPVEVRARAIDFGDGELAVVSAARDITERKQAEETIARMAFYDELTGLANRALFLDRLRIALAQSARSTRPVAVMFLDLDHFKHVNDTLGHNVGDQLLQAVASRLARSIREGDTLARLGGDEFTFILPDIVDEDHAGQAAKKLLSLFDDDFEVEGGLRVSASIGIAVLTGADATVEDAIGRADAAVYRAKEESRNCYRFYEEKMRVTANERFSLKSRLHAALDNTEFVVFYQPQVRAEGGRMVGVEALVRWMHPERGLLLPGAFLELVEEAGLMDQLGAWVLRTACSQAATWYREGSGALKVAVNVSPRQFMHPGFSAIVADALVSTGLPSELLELEVTESAAFAEPERLEGTLASLRSLGVRIAIDDFGTGFNSLDRLRKLRVDAIKIDRSFVSEVETHPDAAAIANTVVVLAHHLGLAVVGEGVETPSQAEFLRARGCDVLQGFLYSAAVPASDIAGMMHTN